MKCCHFKMTGRGKRLPLLAVFKTGESHFIRNKQSLFLKRAVEMKPDFFFSTKSKSLFIALGNGGTLFSPVFPFLSLLSLPFSSGVRQWPKPPGRFDQQYCSKAADICPNGEEAFFFFETPSHASCHLSEKQTCLCCKKMLKEEKNVCVKKNGDVRGGTLEEARGCKAEGIMSQPDIFGEFERCSCFEF